MNCPYCASSQVMVVNSRNTMTNYQVWRRRKCLACLQVFTTHETIDLSHLVVVKKSGEKERYNRIKLLSGIYSAAVSSKPKERRELVEKVVREVESKILSLKKKEISSKEIGDIALRSLMKLSPGVFLGFLAYHKDINDKSQIKKEFKKYDI